MSSQEQQLPDKPRPEPTHENQAYWDGLKAHRLLVQQCSNCQQIRHYPRPMCDRCYSLLYDWTELSGRGTVHSWTVSHHPFHPGFKREVPYTTVTVDLAEGVRLQAPLIDAGGATLKIGLGVEIDYFDVDAELTQPCFRVSE